MQVRCKLLQELSQKRQIEFEDSLADCYGQQCQKRHSNQEKPIVSRALYLSRAVGVLWFSLFQIHLLMWKTKNQNISMCETIMSQYKLLSYVTTFYVNFNETCGLLNNCDLFLIHQQHKHITTCKPPVMTTNRKIRVFYNFKVAKQFPLCSFPGILAANSSSQIWQSVHD